MERSGEQSTSLVLQPAAQICERHHDVLAVNRAQLEPLVPGGYMPKLRALDVQLEIAVEGCADRDVGERELVADKKRPGRKDPVEHPKVLGTAGEASVDGRPVALGFWCAVVAPEDTIEEIGVERVFRTIHSSVHIGPIIS